MMELTVPIGRMRRKPSSVDVSGGSVSGFSFSIRSESLDRVDATLLLYLQDRPVGAWGGVRMQAGGWAAFLGRLAQAWPYLRVEEVYPERVVPRKPSDLAAVLLAKPYSNDIVAEWVVTFRKRHDIASWLGTNPSSEGFVLLREGNYFVAEADGRMLRLPFGDVLRTLRELGDAVERLVETHEAESCGDALDAWRKRDELPTDELERIASGMDEARLVRLEEVLPKRTRTQIFAGMDEVRAAARGLAPIMADRDIEHVASAIREQPRVPVSELDRLARLAERELAALPAETHPIGRLEGLAIARWFRESVMKIGEDTRFDVEQYLSAMQVPIRRVEMQADVEAVAFWGPSHGPGILLNPTGRRSRVVRKGYDGGTRFTLAHELCHLLLDTRGSLPVAEVMRRMGRSPVEERANAFAAELLLPERGAALVYRNGQELEEVVKSITQRFGVTRTLTAYQLLKSHPEGSPVLPEADRRRLEEIVGRTHNPMAF